MVNHGRSGACNTCLRRRVACDEAKPACSRCRNSNFVCYGYEKTKRSIKFKDQTSYALAKSERRPRGYTKPKPDEHSTWKLELQSLDESYDIQAITLFFNHIVLPGRDKSSTSGLFEIIIPLYATCSQQSPLYHAILATAMVILTLRRGEPADGFLPSKCFNTALASLQNALSNQCQSKQNEILMATILLQLRENIIAMNQSRQVSPVHHRGAVSLVEHRGFHNYEDDASKYLLLQVLHNEVASAIRHGGRVHSDLLRKCLRKDMPSNASFELDKLGIVVAEIQTYFKSLNVQDHGCCNAQCTSQEDLDHLHNQASALEQKLQSWARSVPSYWQPFRLSAPPDSIPTYRNICEIYPSIQIASIWNTWRCYRIINLKVVMACSLGQLSCVLALDRSPSRDYDKKGIYQSVQQCLDSISYSVPFYLGNRHSKWDLYSAAPNLEFPSYHNLSAEEFSSLQLSRHCTVLPHEVHSRHVLGQGAWHILSHLSHVSDLLSDTTGKSMRSCSQSDQINWIEEQLVRAAFLLGLSPNMNHSCSTWTKDGVVSGTWVKTVAQLIKT